LLGGVKELMDITTYQKSQHASNPREQDFTQMEAVGQTAISPENRFSDDQLAKPFLDLSSTPVFTVPSNL